MNTKSMNLISSAGLLWLGSCCGALVKAQIPKEPVAVLSPNATNFQLFGEIPVSPYTGIANIEVPIYTIKEGPINAPISLSYHASGFRPDQHPGWVGQGWNLSVGGVVNRTIRDLPDEYDDPTTGGYALQRGFYFTHSYLNTPDWDSEARMRALCDEQDRGVPKYAGDTEPDAFSFNFSNYSGKFYMDHNGNWQVQSNKPLKVSLLNPSSPFVDVSIPHPHGSESNGAYPKTFGGFSILTEDGTQYVFGGVAEAIEYSLPFYAQTASWLADSWQLTNIIAPDGHQLTFTYQRENNKYINQMYIAFDQNISTGNTQDGNYVGNISCESWSSDLSGVADAYYQGKLLAPVYLSSIQGTTTTVSFARDNSIELPYQPAVYSYRYTLWQQHPVNNFMPYLEVSGDGINYSTNPQALMARLQWKQLNQISISQLGVPQKSFSFSYSQSNSERLTLKKLTEVGSDGSTITPYQFAYNDYVYDGVVLNNQQPQYLANRTDHWGFYDDRYAPFNDRVNYYSNRAPTSSLAVSQSGLLKQIIYPTGGVTDFTYESNMYAKQLDLSRNAPTNYSANQLAGGVRIKRISSYSLTDITNKLVKEYFYVSGYSAQVDPTTLSQLPSTGVLGGQIAYNISYTLVSHSNSNDITTSNVFSSQSALPSSMNSLGSHIGYSQVVEKLSDNSYTKFYYSNFDTELGHPDDPGNVLQKTRTPYEPFSSREQERGSLTKTELYTVGDICVKRQQIDYDVFPQPTDPSAYVRAVKVRLTAICSNTQTSLEEGTAYKLYTYAYLPIKDTETIYDSNGANGLATTTTYQYDPSKLVASTSTVDSKGYTVTTAYRYPFNINYSGNQAPTAPDASAIYAMTARNMLSYPIEIIKTLNGLTTAATVQTYRWAGANSAYILPYQTYVLEPVQPLPTGQYILSSYGTSFYLPFVIAGNNSQMRLKATWSLYDAKSNPLGLVKEGNVLSSFLWGYKNALPIAKVENAAPNEVYHNNFEESTGWDTGLNGYDTSQVRTGNQAGYTTSASWDGQHHTFSTTPLTIALPIAKKFVFSGWVYTEGPTAQLWLFMYRQNETGYYSYVDYVQTNAQDASTQNKWIYLQKEVVVPADVVRLNFRVTNCYNSALPNNTRIWFDDLRIHPADAQMTTYTHRPGIGVTSISDANNKPVLYEYDALNRLGIVRDQDGNVTKSLEYHYHL